MRTDHLETLPFVSTAGGSRADLETGGTIGRYRIKRKLGSGGMAVVYEASGATDERVALKVARPDLDPAEPHCRRSVSFEAVILEHLHHPAIPRLLDHDCLHDGRPYLVLELVDGVSLGQHLRPGGLPLDEVAEVLDQIAAGLATAHQLGIVHCDVKPANVLLCQEGRRLRCKLIDWGVARARALEAARSAADCGMVTGTPLYMSPEQVRGEEVGPSADVYALGVMAFEMICGEPLFDSSSSFAALLAHCRDEPQWPAAASATVPEAVQDLVLATLAKQPDQRPSLATFRAELGTRCKPARCTGCAFPRDPDVSIRHVRNWHV